MSHQFKGRSLFQNAWAACGVKTESRTWLVGLDCIQPGEPTLGWRGSSRKVIFPGGWDEEDHDNHHHFGHHPDYPRLIANRAGICSLTGPPSLTLSLRGANRSDPSLCALYRPGFFFKGGLWVGWRGTTGKVWIASMAGPQQSRRLNFGKGVT